MKKGRKHPFYRERLNAGSNSVHFRSIEVLLHPLGGTLPCAILPAGPNSNCYQPLEDTFLSLYTVQFRSTSSRL